MKCGRNSTTEKSVYYVPRSQLPIKSVDLMDNQSTSSARAMTYRYHVFLSYRRYGEWPQWVEKIFLPIFMHYLGEELGEQTKILFNKEMGERCRLAAKARECLGWVSCLSATLVEAVL